MAYETNNHGRKGRISFVGSLGPYKTLRNGRRKAREGPQKVKGVSKKFNRFFEAPGPRPQVRHRAPGPKTQGPGPQGPGSKVSQVPNPKKPQYDDMFSLFEMIHVVYLLPKRRHKKYAHVCLLCVEPRFGF